MWIPAWVCLLLGDLPPQKKNAYKPTIIIGIIHIVVITAIIMVFFLVASLSNHQKGGTLKRRHPHDPFVGWFVPFFVFGFEGRNKNELGKNEPTQDFDAFLVCESLQQSGFHLLRNILYFPLLVLKGIHHDWTCYLFCCSGVLKPNGSREATGCTRPLVHQKKNRQDAGLLGV